MSRLLAMENNLIHGLFEEMVELHPHELAILYCDESLSYQQINTLANQLARYLQNAGLQFETPVAIYFDRSPWLIIAILAILKAGGAYIPLDPAYPEKRNQLILEDSKVGIFLTQKKYANTFPSSEVKIILIDEVVNFCSQLSAANLNLPLKNTFLAYILYTSGTTGRPKGIAIEHRNTVGLLNWAKTEYSNRQMSGILAVTSVCFDLSIFEIFLPLVTGNKIILINDIEDIKILSVGVRNQISLINTVPSAINLLLDLDLIPSSVNTVNLAGEPLSKNIVERLYAIPTLDKIYNLYGPSETTTYATCALLKKSVDMIPTIGKPIAGACIFLLDDCFNPVPTGEVGEIYIGGFGVSRGYYNNSEQTDKQFINISVFSQNLRRLFKTGDLAVFTEEGELRFLGRIDHQIKLRGFRIEPEEIESVLMSHPEIQQAVVLALTENMRVNQLVSCICLKKQNKTAPGQILDYLKIRLPSYMIPSKIVLIDVMPLNANGKIDRKTLLSSYLSLNTEEKITDIWKNLLGVEVITCHDNFFDFGGHSLLLIKMKIQLEKIFQINIKKIELFKHPTISELTKYIIQRKNEKIPEKINNIVDENSKNKFFTDNDIAIIGMSGRFPGASTIEQFWQNLCAGVESIVDIPESKVTDSKYVKRAAWLEDIELFDKDFFNYTTKEAQLLDPQQRIFLECAWEALENAGYSVENSQGRIGVFSASEKSDYLENVLKHYLDDPSEMGNAEKFLIRISNDKDYLSTRVSYKLNLTGPSINVQTACSSSLVAIHLARQSLLMDECDLALAGAVAVHIPQKTGYVYQEGMITSPDGYCRAFDAKANGTVFGNGAGVVILKRYSKAKLDNDHIYAVIKGSAINNDGIKKLGFTAPSIEGQAAVIKMALQDAKIKSDSIHYVEAHGAGTPLGDPIEVAALTQAFAERSASLPRCALGSVKTNIGHLDSAAGIAGFIKTVLILKNKQLPPSLHFVSPNPEIDFANSPFYVCQKLTPWPGSEKLSYAGVSSFGIGGTNSHVILGEPPEYFPKNLLADKQFFILPLSAKNQPALKILAQRYVSFLENKKNSISLQDVCYTAAIGRIHFSHRLAVIGSNWNEMVNNIKCWLTSDKDPCQETDSKNEIAKNYMKGQPINWSEFYQNKVCRRIPLPTYPFQKQRCWVDHSASKQLFSILGKRLVLPFIQQIVFENIYSVNQPSYNNHHRLFGKVVVPGSSHLAVFIAALNKIYPTLNYSFNDIFFLNPFVILEQEQCQVQVIVNEDTTDECSIKITACRTNDWRVLVEGKFQINKNPVIHSVDVDAIKKRCLSEISGQDFYNQVWVPGLDTGNSFRWIKKIWYTTNQEAICYSNPPVLLDEIEESLHPGLIETCFQLLNACWHFDTKTLRNENFIYVPFSIQKLNFIKFPDAEETCSYARIREINQQTQTVTADVYVFDKQGNPILEVLGFEVKKLYSEHLTQASSKQKNLAKVSFSQRQANHILEKIIQAAPAQRKAILYDYMSYLMQRILGVGIKNHVLDYSRGFIDYGLDSLMSIELRNQLQLDLNLKLSATFAFDYFTIDQVVVYLENEFNKNPIKENKPESISEKVQQEYDQLELLLSNNKNWE